MAGLVDDLDLFEVITALERAGWTDVAIGKRCQVNASTVGRWKAGDFRPRYMQRVALMNLYSEIAETQNHVGLVFRSD